MLSRWRGRTAGLAIMAIGVLPLVATAATARSDPTLVVRGPDDGVLAELPLPDAGFTLRYRNSLYGSTAEERYVVGADGAIRLTELAADELAVLEEYYAIDEPARRAEAGVSRAWRADPARPVVIDRLIVAATDLGRRTLLVEGQPPVALWQLVSDEAPSVELTVRVP
jgi:hypothetical protein